MPSNSPLTKAVITSATRIARELNQGAHQLEPEKFSKVCLLALHHAQSTGESDPAFIRELIELASCDH